MVYGLLRVMYVGVRVFEVYIEFYILLVVRARACVRTVVGSWKNQ